MYTTPNMVAYTQNKQPWSDSDPTCPRVLCLRVRFSAGTTQNWTQGARSDAECYKLCLLIICKNEILITPPNLKNS